MIAIWKYQVDLTKAVEHEFQLEVPDGAKYISCMQSSNEKIVDVYFEVETHKRELTDAFFRYYMTGEPLSPLRGQHIGTFKTDGWIVGHLYVDVH